MAKMSSVEAVVNDVSLVAHILRWLDASRHKHSAALVCRAWNEAMRWASRRLSVRYSASLERLSSSFCHVQELGFNFCFDLLDVAALKLVSQSFKNLRSLFLGSAWIHQEFVTNKAVEYIALGCPLLERLELAYLPNLQDEGIRTLVVNCKNIKSLSLESCSGLTDSSLEYIEGWTNLQTISLVGSFNFTSTGLSSIAGCKDLNELRLELEHTELDAALNSVASSCTSLHSVELKFKCEVNLEGLSNCTTLENLTIIAGQGRQLDNVMVRIAEANRKLMELTFICPSSPLAESSIISIVKSCPRLRKLHLDTSMSEVALVSMALACRDLEHLCLDRYRYPGAEGLFQLGFTNLQLKHLSLRSAWNIKDVEIQMLVSGKKRLEHLELLNCVCLTSIGFSAIATCSRLQHLDLSFTSVDDLSLSEIASGVKTLRTLWLTKCQSLTSCWCIAQFPLLENLSLDQCNFVTDEGLNVIADGCPLLSSINLAFTRITDTGLAWLSKCKELRILSVPYCLAIRGEGLLAISSCCDWLQLVVISHRFRDSEVTRVLNNRYCFVRLEVDDMALVPFRH